MANEDELAEAKQWCDEARQLLKTKKIAKNGDSEIRDRVNKILSELNTLDKGATKGKYGLTPERVTEYVGQFSSMAGALNSAAKSSDSRRSNDNPCG